MEMYPFLSSEEKESGGWLQYGSKAWTGNLCESSSTHWHVKQMYFIGCFEHRAKATDVELSILQNIMPGNKMHCVWSVLCVFVVCVECTLCVWSVLCVCVCLFFVTY